MKNAVLRAQVEQSLQGKVSSPFAIRSVAATVLAASGVKEIDALVGGMPRGSVTEVCGEAGTGRSSFLVALLAAMTRRKEFCALVDGRSSFDPCGAQAAGVMLERLLWVRCNNVEEALRSADLLLHGGGFGVVAVDLCDLPVNLVRRVPMSTWFRFRQMVENTPTVCLLLGQQAYAKSCSSLVLRLEMQGAQWRGEPEEAQGFANPQRVLLEGMEISAEVELSRLERNTFEKDGSHFAKRSMSKHMAVESVCCKFETTAEWAQLGKKTGKKAAAQGMKEKEGQEKQADGGVFQAGHLFGAGAKPHLVSRLELAKCTHSMRDVGKQG